ncbi:uncharacterized protein LOC121995202 [Zingiber officinale]|uniref:uncharacterized protein LOC121995202 n=1 Tax=Zingiber officinale TaxID=94328 RepID=UPI001C4D1360|nr:uncharacterized protein LOC121995202 [Zingiber officinale]
MPSPDAGPPWFTRPPEELSDSSYRGLRRSLLVFQSPLRSSPIILKELGNPTLSARTSARSLRGQQPFISVLLRYPVIRTTVVSFPGRDHQRVLRTNSCDCEGLAACPPACCREPSRTCILCSALCVFLLSAARTSERRAPSLLFVFPIRGRARGREELRCCANWWEADYIMFDCGMHMAYLDHRRFPDFSLISETGDFNSAPTCVVIAHFHLDHVGALPYLQQFVGIVDPYA